MFTGITRGTFPVTRIERKPDLLRYEVDLGELAAGLELGASVSIDGVCQTVVAMDDGCATFEAINETLDRTTLTELEEGTRVSAERSFRVGDEIGGHEVSGHVIGTGTVVQATRGGDVCDLRIRVPASYSFWDLHVAIQDSMGWLDYHLHEFRVLDPRSLGGPQTSGPHTRIAPKPRR